MPPKNTTDIQKLIDSINLEPLHEQFPNVDVDSVYEDFASVCLQGTPKKPGPNPYNYKNFSLALLNWLKKEDATPIMQRRRPSQSQPLYRCPWNEPD